MGIKKSSRPGGMVNNISSKIIHYDFGLVWNQGSGSKTDSKIAIDSLMNYSIKNSGSRYTSQLPLTGKS